MGGRVAAFEKNFESNQYEVILITIKKHLKLNDNEPSIMLDEYSKSIIKKRDEFKIELENGEKDNRKMDEKKIVKFSDRKFGELESNKELKNVNKDDLLVSYDFNWLHPGAQTDLNNIWPKIESTYPFQTL